jgi:hypothetical protein
MVESILIMRRLIMFVRCSTLEAKPLQGAKRQRQTVQGANMRFWADRVTNQRLGVHVLAALFVCVACHLSLSGNLMIMCLSLIE